ncbi:MAG: hypothetical protein JG762_608 [Deferribacteraceae bacterium]|jgi:hypothetical protein|nr:hypothetical protein [Deferribacteraceae bacterium]
MNLKKGTSSLILENIVDEVYDTLKSLTIEDYVIGLNYVAVRTEAGTGLAYSFFDNQQSECCVDITSLKGIKGKEVAGFIYNNNFLLNSILVAMINSILKNGVEDNLQLYDRFDFKDKIVGMVGDFKPLTKNIKDTAKRLDIYELKNIPGTIKPNFAKLFLRETDYLIVTGSTLVNFTADDFINFAKDTCEIIFVGPTAPLSIALSEIAHIAGSSVNNHSKCFDIVKKGGGMHALKSYLVKKWLAKN